jgi:hypothetical protein
VAAFERSCEVLDRVVSVYPFQTTIVSEKDAVYAVYSDRTLAEERASTSCLPETSVCSSNTELPHMCADVRVEPVDISRLALPTLAAPVGESATARTDRTDASTERTVCAVLHAAKMEAATAQSLQRADAARVLMAAAALPVERMPVSSGLSGPESDRHDVAPTPKVEASGDVCTVKPVDISRLALPTLAAPVGESATARTDRTDASTERTVCAVLHAAKAEMPLPLAAYR